MFPMSDLRADTNVDDLEKGVGDRAALQKRTYDVPEDRIWTVYNRETDKVDRALVERWKGDMDVLLIFAGLFSAVVTAFIIEGYKFLSVDPADTTAALLNQISMQLAAAANGSQFALPSQSLLNAPFEASRGIVRVNVCWFLSLTLSLATALAATLAQQWSRYYLQAVQRREVPRIRGRIRCFLFEGVERFRMTAVIEGIPALLHVAVFLFFGGLVEFLLPIDTVVCFFVLGIVSVCGALYTIISILPCLIRQCPFRSPLTSSAWYTLQTIAQLREHFLRSVNIYRRTRVFNKSFNDAQEYAAQLCPSTLRPSKLVERDFKAFNWILESLTDHSELLPFIENIPGYLKMTESAQSQSLLYRDRKMVIIRLFNDTNLMERVCLLLSSHQHSVLPSGEVRRRTLACHRIVECAAPETVGALQPKQWDRLTYIGGCALMHLTLLQEEAFTHSELWDKVVGPSSPFHAIFRRFDIHPERILSRSSMTACALIGFIGYVAEHPQWHDMNVTFDTYQVLWHSYRYGLGVRRFDQEIQHSLVSFCAQMEGLEPRTLERQCDYHLSIPQYMKHRTLMLLDHVDIPEERRRAIAIMRILGRWDEPYGVDNPLNWMPRNDLGRLVEKMRKWEEELACDAQQGNQREEWQSPDTYHDERTPSSVLPPDWDTRKTPLGRLYHDDLNTKSATWNRPPEHGQVNSHAREGPTVLRHEQHAPHSVTTPPEDEPEVQSSINAERVSYSSRTAHLAHSAVDKPSQQLTYTENYAARPSQRTSSLVVHSDTSPPQESLLEEPTTNSTVYQSV